MKSKINCDNCKFFDYMGDEKFSCNNLASEFFGKTTDNSSFNECKEGKEIIVCRNCKYMTSMNDSYFCSNKNSSNYGEETGFCCEDFCPDAEEME